MPDEEEPEVIEEPKPQHKPKQVKESPVKIETKAASVQELFEEKLLDIVEDVLRRRITPNDSLHKLHEYWMSLTEKERTQLVDVEQVGSIHSAGARLKAAADMLGNEMPALVASHLNSRSIG